MTALADASTIADGKTGWLVVLGILAVGMAALLHLATRPERRARKNARSAPVHTNQGRGGDQCPQRGCTAVATVPVWKGLVLENVCPGCADEGCALYGWERA